MTSKYGWTLDSQDVPIPSSLLLTDEQVADLGLGYEVDEWEE